jgi:hypothetical protein
MKQAAILLFACLVLHPPLTIAAQTPADIRSALTIAAAPARAVVKPGDPITLRLTFRNTSAAAFRLPDEINPPSYPYWFLQAQDVNTGKVFTGVSSRPAGASPEPGEIHPELLRAGEAKTVVVAFAAFVFVEGAMELAAAQNLWFPQRTRPASDFALPPGRYTIRVHPRFRSYPNRPGSPQRILDEIALIEKHPIPLWKGNAQSDVVQIRIADDAVAQPSETIQIARDVAVAIRDFLKTTQLDGAFVSPTTHTGLWRELSTLETAASGVRDRETANTFDRALTQAVAHALEISQRTTESVGDRKKAQQLSFRLRQFALPLGVQCAGRRGC